MTSTVILLSSLSSLFHQIVNISTFCSCNFSVQTCMFLYVLLCQYFKGYSVNITFLKTLYIVCCYRMKVNRTHKTSLLDSHYVYFIIVHVFVHACIPACVRACMRILFYLSIFLKPLIIIITVKIFIYRKYL